MISSVAVLIDSLTECCMMCMYIPGSNIGCSFDGSGLFVTSTVTVLITVTVVVLVAI